jgi:hypothetical protein
VNVVAARAAPGERAVVLRCLIGVALRALRRWSFAAFVRGVAGEAIAVLFDRRDAGEFAAVAVLAAQRER